MLDDDNVAIYICFELMDSELKDFVRKNHLSEKELLSFAWDISEERLHVYFSVSFIVKLPSQRRKTTWTFPSDFIRSESISSFERFQTGWSLIRMISSFVWLNELGILEKEKFTLRTIQEGLAKSVDFTFGRRFSSFWI